MLPGAGAAGPMGDEDVEGGRKATLPVAGPDLDPEADLLQGRAHRTRLVEMEPVRLMLAAPDPIVTAEGSDLADQLGWTLPLARLVEDRPIGPLGEAARRPSRRPARPGAVEQQKAAAGQSRECPRRELGERPEAAASIRAVIEDLPKGEDRRGNRWQLGVDVGGHAELARRHPPPGQVDLGGGEVEPNDVAPGGENPRSCDPAGTTDLEHRARRSLLQQPQRGARSEPRKLAEAGVMHEAEVTPVAGCLVAGAEWAHAAQATPATVRSSALPFAAVISTNQFKNGAHIEVDGKVFKILDFQHVKPGKGGAFVRTKLRRHEDGSVIDKTFRAGEKFRPIHTENRKMQYLYESGDTYVFMDTQTFDQLELPADIAGEAIQWVLPNDEIDILFVDEEPGGVQVASAVDLAVTQTDPGLKGDTASGGGTKPATLETGVVVHVPLFIEEGERIRVDTRNGEYVSRA